MTVFEETCKGPEIDRSHVASMLRQQGRRVNPQNSHVLMEMRRFRLSSAIGVAAALLIGLSLGALGQGNPVLVGKVARVTDGDTITVQLTSGPITVRLGSIDAPERDQPWGKESGTALADLLEAQEVAIDVQSQDRYDRLVAVVYLGDVQVNAWMVEKGHAWAYREYLTDIEYCNLEYEARKASRGLWELDHPRAPWEWRRRPQAFTDYGNETAANCKGATGRSSSTRQVTPASGNRSPGQCLIKGNISESGRIYHVPGSRNYDTTRIDEMKGERWFCTEAEARAAGWRPPKG